MIKTRALFGEFLGTLILSVIGCSSVAFSVLFNVFDSIVPVALIWGIGVALAIYATKSYSKAHLNPAVSLGFFIQKQINYKELFSYWLFQLLGGFVAGLVVYLCFISKIKSFEYLNNIIPHTDSGSYTAAIFGEFFPNPGYKLKLSYVSQVSACAYECIGTFFLMWSILCSTRSEKISRYSPLIIGLTVSVLIVWIAPYTQCGINPARDFGPRLVACFFHWGSGAFPDGDFSFFNVYIISPMMGAFLSSFLYEKMYKIVKG